ncbi:LCP family protein [Thalassobacillus sp. CUG 92003]|uniref:LCP family protein n=1 Tax=Thalassobacillus sp. CUG 92003 TaxID=2736641 RepID=UPI0015E7586C|nr:LCP family protein [Thalassobacillus sp. CUG 92003]
MKYKKIKITIVFLLFLVLVGVGTTAGYAMYLTDKAKEASNNSHEELDRGEKSDRRDTAINPDLDNTTVLFVGVDDSEKRSNGDHSEAPSRSDALVLASFNESDNSVNMVNIPRDSYVNIPYLGYKDKITHAHAYGGIDATVKTVEELFEVPVDYYVRLNFNSFVETVDALNGIDFDVPFDIKEQNSKDRDNAIELSEGEQHINGEEALALARTRKYDSDLARGERQMKLIQAIVRRASEVGSISNYGDVIDSIGNNMKTNLTFEEMISFKDYAINKEGLEFNKSQLEGEPTTIDGVWYYRLQENSLANSKAMLQQHLGLNQNNEEDSNSYTENDRSSEHEDSM